jgi:PleD family two-component response regulator
MISKSDDIQTALAQIQSRAEKGAFLVVDDFDSMRSVTTNQLRQLGVTNVIEAMNGASALKILNSQPISVILSDWNMPVMDGMDLLIAVRTNPKLCNLPFIMITAEAERERVMQAIQIGVTELLVKPYTGGRFASSLSRAAKAPLKQRGPISMAAVEAVIGKSAADSPEADKMVGATSAPPALELPTRAQLKEKASILIVDDTPDNLTLLSHIFMDSYRVQLAQNGAKALQICQSDAPPDLILLDIMMPEIDGFEVAEQLRSHPTSENIPIIFVTAMTDDAARIKGMELGAVDFVTKPVDPDALRMRVTNFMRYVELHRQIQADYDSMLAMAKLKDDVELITRHDMKSPLAAVLGLVQGVIGSAQLDETHRQQLQLAEEAALQALNMINLSSELYKIETGRFELKAKPLPLVKILRHSAAMMKKAFAENQFNFVIETPPGIDDASLSALGEEMFCYSVFENLIKNACEAAPAGSVIAIHLYQETPVRVTVENSGVVPVEVRENFFDKFNSHGKTNGTGLGTYSAKRLIEAQNGTVAMSTNDKTGKTLITITLPAA